MYLIEGGKEEVRRVKEEVELTKVKYKLSIFIAWIYQETPLNIDFGIKNEKQYCKIDTLGNTCEIGRVNEGDEDEGIWLMGFIYIYEIEQ
jgi:hypothetical protein